MMRNMKWLVTAALAVSTTGCVESMDSGYAAPSYGYGYGNGYSNGYYAQSNGYYAQPTYYTPPVVYSQTRYVPVPTPVPVPVPQHQANRTDHRSDGDHRWDGRHDEPRHVDRQPASPPPATHNTSTPTHNNTSSGSSVSSVNHRDGSRDRDNDRRS
jgi:hypothetical protein